jgi:ATP-dependent Clp protease adapter protein ClpS
MDAMSGDAEPMYLLVHNDEETPQEFVRELMQRVFGKTAREAIAFIGEIEREASARSGPYPRTVAETLLQSAQAYIADAGHRLRITTAAMKSCCDLCGKTEESTEITIDSKIACLCGACMLAVARASPSLADDTFRCAGSASRPARASCSTGRPAPARPTRSAISPPTCPGTRH